MHHVRPKSKAKSSVGSWSLRQEALTAGCEGSCASFRLVPPCLFLACKWKHFLASGQRDRVWSEVCTHTVVHAFFGKTFLLYISHTSALEEWRWFGSQQCPTKAEDSNYTLLNLTELKLKLNLTELNYTLHSVELGLLFPSVGAEPQIPKCALYWFIKTKINKSFLH